MAKPSSTLNETCVPYMTYNFNVNATEKVGHIKKVSFTNAGVDLVADTSVPNPTDPSAKVDIIGAFDRNLWDGSPSDPVLFQFRVSQKNRSLINSVLADEKGGAEVEIEWVLYDYNFGKKKYFEFVTTKEVKIKFVIPQEKGAFTVEEKPAEDVPQPRNYVAYAKLNPISENEEQVLHIAYEEGSPKPHRMGVKKAT